MTDDLKNAETSLVWALDKASTSLEVRSAVNKALGYVRQAQAPAQGAKDQISAIVLSAILGKADGETYGASHARKMNEERAEKAAERILALRAPATSEPVQCSSASRDPVEQLHAALADIEISAYNAAKLRIGWALEALGQPASRSPAASESAANDINQPLMDLEIFIGEVDGAEAAQEGTIDGTEAIAALAKVREQTAWLEAQASGCASIMRDLRAFHVACGAPVPKVPQFPSEDRINLRLDILDEEHRELHDAVRDRDLVEVADALADIIYVTAGMALEFGVPLERVWNEVHRSNMAKVDPVTGKVRRRDDGKVLKPEGWTPPDIMAALTPLTEPCPYCDAEMVVTAPSCEACGREHPDRFTVTCTCRGNNDCDGSCQCPPDRPAHTSTVSPSDDDPTSSDYAREPF
ncbi:Predicted phosphohydrolase, Cof family, HAD superfamily [Bradyrhizobium yuanmingense]|uniref:Predicted phosphohydrolase, Cof family, HAD superfamily n=1 Tax=Bradyrhizobium yuanmingense TaxID=108015 RepID=A0A1C3XHZ4_9BRAD|nr:nucleoside triphosphate pyrophosphohydrolase family protein [Bradyrhizobium yuanmingense]TWI18947.1 putative HAD superfamily Cof-like phosphohydrolase [Bradyrhizobium yuanmingense]SCB51775.1 Predicted phosphohydrolase, Cof family, HAD superfamily [Bradyrhizobium yuanmingense]